MVKGVMNDIGIMQGRLLPPVNGRLQAFPGKEWAKEFPLARECGFDAVELIFDLDGIEINPLNSENGVKQIQELTNMFDIKVRSVCADYFMGNGFLRVTEDERNENIKVLRDLTYRCQKIRISYIVLPFVDQAEVRTDEELEKVRISLLSVLEQTDECDVVYALEMSLPAETIASFLDEVDHPRLKINYDTGNSTALGYDLVSEIEQLYPWIVDVHIKDRKVGGESCLLGEGDTDFDGVFAAFAKMNYRGPFILQTQRGTDEIETANNHLRFIKDKIAQHYLRTKGKRA